MAEPREVIESIRRDEFGIDATLDVQGRTIVDNLTRRYRKLLATVAEDLNSKDSHFILELIQNADDNSYALEVAPSLKFEVEGDRLVIVNNELGFQEEHVRALCSAGESSKKRKTGYIGEKGIGFKSVFKVSDAPEIHSNGYHFRFDRTGQEDLLGYVVPHWHVPSAALDEDTTTLVLPARDGRPFSTGLLSDLSDTLLLFLDQLRSIEVIAPGQREEFTRHDDGAITTLITDSAGATCSQKYLRIRSRIDTSDLREPKREDISATDVVLAFPLGDEGDAAPVPGCATFAFLPIRDFGFNFFVQADFVLISSREGIHENLAWNLRLRDSIAIAFLAAIEEFKSRPGLSTTFLRFLPSKREVHDAFFAPVVDQLHSVLRETACIPDESGGWNMPSKVLITSDQVRGLFSSSDAIELFEAAYPLQAFHFPAALREALGCKFLSPADIVSIFKSRPGWFLVKDAKWKARFFVYLASSPMRKDLVNLLSRVACLPTASGKLARPDADTVFFPLSSSRRYGFEHELNVLDAEVFNNAVEIAPEVRGLFSELMVRQDNPLELIQSHILPFHASQSFASAEAEAVLGHVRYVRDRLKVYLVLAGATRSEAEALRVLRDGLLVGTKLDDGDNWRFDRAPSLYLGKEFRPDFCIETLLDGSAPPERVVSGLYLGRPRKGAQDKHDEEIIQWREFFLRIGVNASPRIESTSPSGDFACSAELLALLRADSAQVRRKTLECLDANWATYAGHATYQVRGRSSYANYWCSFVTQLRQTVAPTKQRTQAHLESAFQKNLATLSILGGGAVFVEAELHSKGFLDACGITYEVNADACLKRLRQIKAQGRGGIEQARKIYRRLEGLWSAEHGNIEKAFAAERLIRIGLGEGASWVSPAGTSWNATGIEFLDKRHPSLGSQYKDFSSFFTKLLKVPLELDLDKWVDGLAAMGSIDDPKERDEAATSVYRRLNRATKQLAEAPGQLRPTWLSRFDREPLILNHRGQFVVKTDDVFADDLPDYSVLFADVENISFLSISADRLPAFAPLLGAWGLPNVSDSIKIEVQDGCDGVVNETYSRKLRKLVIPIARVVYTQSHDRFAAAVADGAFELIGRSRVIDVEELVQLVSLAGAQRVNTGNIARRGDDFLLRLGAPSRVDYLAMEISKAVRLPKGASDAVGRLLMCESLEDADSFLSVRGFRTLPPEEEQFLRTREVIELGGAPNEDLARQERTQRIAGGRPEKSGQDEDVLEPGSKNDGLEELARLPEKFGTSGSPSRGAPGPTVPPDACREGGGVRSSRTSLGGEQVEPWDTESSSPEPGPGIGRHVALGDPEVMGAPGGRQKPRAQYRTRTGRLLSYADPVPKSDANGEDPSKSDPKVAAHKVAVEKAAVAYFLETAANHWQEVREMPHQNKGFDIKAVAMDGADEMIEIKGQARAWTEEGVALTPSEMAMALRQRDRYWLCVVEFALDASRRRLWLVRDPFGQTSQFRFDLGWKDVADRVEGKPTRPEVGMFVDVPGKGKGRIVEIKGKAVFSKMKVERANKSTFFATFHPATMALSLD
jgi:hypothetical protein